MLSNSNYQRQLKHGTSSQSNRKRPQFALHFDVIVIWTIVSSRFLHQPLQLGWSGNHSMQQKNETAERFSVCRTKDWKKKRNRMGRLEECCCLCKLKNSVVKIYEQKFNFRCCTWWLRFSERVIWQQSVHLIQIGCDVLLLPFHHFWWHSLLSSNSWFP